MTMPRQSAWISYPPFMSMMTFDHLIPLLETQVSLSLEGRCAKYQRLACLTSSEPFGQTDIKAFSKFYFKLLLIGLVDGKM